MIYAFGEYRLDTRLCELRRSGGIVRMDIHNGRVKLYDEDTKEGLQDEHKPQE